MTIRRLLIVRVGAMGDILHALPAVAALRGQWPHVHLGWALEPRWLPLLQDARGRRPLVNSVHPVPTRLWKQRPVSLATLRSVAELRRELRAGQYDLAVDLQGSIRSAVIGRLAGASEGLAGSAAPRERPARLLYGKRVLPESRHVVPQACELLGGAVGLALSPAPVPLPADPAAEAAVTALLGSLPARPLALLVPQAGWGAKQWPAERFGELARALHSHGLLPLVNSLGTADPLAAMVVQASGGLATPVDLPLPELIALTRRVALVVAGDTGPLHLAAALRRPVVALFGPTDPDRNGPWDTPARVLRHPASRTDHRRFGAPEEGLLHISTDEVLLRALDLLQFQPAGPTA